MVGTEISTVHFMNFAGFVCYLQICPYDFIFIHILKEKGFEMMCNSMELLSLNELSMPCLASDAYNSYFFTELGISILILSNISSPNSFLKPGQWMATYSIIVVLFCRNVTLPWVEWVHWFGQIWQSYWPISTCLSKTIHMCVHVCVFSSQRVYRENESLRCAVLAGNCNGMCGIFTCI